MKLGRKIAVAAMATGLAILPSGAFAGGNGGGPKKVGCQHHCGDGHGHGHGHGGNDQTQEQNQNQQQEQDQSQEQNQCFIVIGLLEPATCG